MTIYPEHTNFFTPSQKNKNTLTKCKSGPYFHSINLNLLELYPSFEVNSHQIEILVGKVIKTAKGKLTGKVLLLPELGKDRPYFLHYLIGVNFKCD